MQTALTYRTNRDLFSNYYLDEHLPETEAWNAVGDEELREAYDEIKELWDREKGTAPQRNESQLEEKFIRPMFRKLGIPFEVEESTDRTQRRPDYGFFETAEAAREAFERREAGGDFYEGAGGFAGFRDNATKTNSLLDRLKAITLPDPDDVADDLRRYLEVKERAEELDEKIEQTDRLIDELVYDLYDLTEEEIEIVEESVTDE